MYDNGTYRPRYAGRPTHEDTRTEHGLWRRARAYLGSRSRECWGFFAAGFVLATILT